MFVSQILFILAIIALPIYFAWRNSPSQKGKRGEKYVGNILATLPPEYITLNDVIFYTGQGTTQIDHIVVSRYGIFVIETKNYRGDIYGNDTHDQWTQIITTDVTYRRKWWKTYTYVTKNHFLNPVKQNNIHVRAISKILSPTLPQAKVFSLVVFAGYASLSGVTSCVPVLQIQQLIPTILQHKEVLFSDNELQTITTLLTKKNVRQEVDNNTHINNIRAKEAIIRTKLNMGICPKCGGTIVERHGKYGRFYGCSNYPTCKFTMN